MALNLFGSNIDKDYPEFSQNRFSCNQIKKQRLAKHSFSSELLVHSCLTNMIKRLLSFPKYNLLQNISLFRFSTFPTIEKFSYLANKLENISKISSRNAGIEELEKLFNEYYQTKDRQLFLSMIRLVSCRVESEEIQIANNSLVEILERAYEDSDITQFLFEKGDIGLYAKAQLEKQIKEKELSLNGETFTPKNMDIKDVIEFYEKLRNLSGEGSRLEKQKLITDFIKNIEDPLEAQFFIRIISKSLRIGVNDKSIIKALMKVNSKHNNSLNDLMKEIQENIFGYTSVLDSCQVGTPIPPMLAKAISDYDSLMKFLKKYESKKVSLELKYDGERSQVHYSKETGVKLFSRNLESYNDKYPQLVYDLQKYFESKSIENCIIDGEIVVTNSEGNIKTFQEQQQNRKRKKEVNVQVQSDIHNVEKIILFDALMVNDQILLKDNQSTRKNLIQQFFPAQHPIDHAEAQILDLNVDADLSQLKTIVKDYVNKKYEGAMVKSLDSTTFYDTNGRTQWAKLKKQVITGGTADTFDVVPIAAYYGKGKRSGLYGAYLLACYDHKSDEFVALCKIGTGFTDNFLQTSTERLSGKVVTEKPKEYKAHRTFKPDVWFSKGVEVWEVECDSLSTSPIYTIGKLGYDDKGISLRFPRFIIVRDDKSYLQSTTVDQMIEFYKDQKINSSESGKDMESQQEESEIEEERKEK